MSGVRRFLSVRDRDKSPRKQHPAGRHHPRESKSNEKLTPVPAPQPADPESAADFYALFEARSRPQDHEEEHKLKVIEQRVLDTKGVKTRPSTILWALRSPISHGDPDAAYNLLLALSDASEGIIRPYNPAVKLKGAINRQGVTCFLDSTLFAMFSRLDSFEAMLYNSFSDLPRKKLSFLLCLWVNLLRSGQLITTDVTQIIQNALADCGWQEAAEIHQQDASEAFTFITEKLQLPLLTLKMDIYHPGKEEAADDHKFINERLLDVAIPEDPSGGRKEITLEDCLEEYFNNRIEVRRYLERRSTLNSIKSPLDGKEKLSAIHVETVEVDPDSSPATPTVSSPLRQPTRPGTRQRTQSIIQERFVPSRGGSAYSSLTNVDTKDSNRSRAGSMRKTVMMEAWQFFSLIPWYTDNTPSDDAQVAAHFSSKRPVLGLCLKRYAFHHGSSVRLNTYVDIPVEIALPHFIQDDRMEENGALFGTFKLSLQSVVCHRGDSVDSGHYIALVRSTRPSSSSASDDPVQQWLRFDDLASQKVTIVDIQRALREETPYLLFYQIVPIKGDPGQITAGERPPSRSMAEESANTGVSSTSLPLSSVSTTDRTSGRPSFEITVPDESRGRHSGGRRASTTLSSDAVAPARDSKKSSVAHSRSGSESLSRQISKSSDGLGRSLSKLVKRSKERLLPEEPSAHVFVREVAEPSSVASEPRTKLSSGHLEVKSHPAPHQKEGGSGYHKRERSREKNRLSKHGKVKEKHPDRECAVM